MSKITRQRAVEEALYSLLRLEHKYKGKIPCDVIMAIGLLEYTMLNSPKTIDRLSNFKARLKGDL